MYIYIHTVGVNNDIKWKGKEKKGENDFAHMR